MTALDANGLSDSVVTTQSTPAESTPQPFLSREQILVVTTRCLRQRGYDATTIRAIAGMLNCAVGSIYRYYKDKHDLLSAVTQHSFLHVERLASDGVPMDESVRQYCNAVNAAPESYRLMFWLACQQKPDAASQAELPAAVTRIISAWGTQLGSRPAAERAWAHLHAYILLGWNAEQCVRGVLEPLGIKIAAPIVESAPTPIAPQPAPAINPVANETAALLDQTPHPADTFESQAVVSDGDDVTLL